MPSSEPIEAINLFRTLQWDDMLPGMFYFAVQLPKRAFLEGAPRADCTLEKLSAAGVAHFIELRAACVAVFESGTSVRGWSEVEGGDRYVLMFDTYVAYG